MSKVGGVYANVDHGGGRCVRRPRRPSDALYVLADDFLPSRPRLGRPPRISDTELICLAVAQMLLDFPSERRFLRLAMRRLGHLFPYLPNQPGYNKRMRALAPQIVQAMNAVAIASPSLCDRLRLLDSTPVPCAASRETVKRSRVRRPGRLRVLRQPQPLFLGLSPLPALRPGRHADRLRARPCERPRTRCRCRNARPRPTLTATP